MSMPVSPSGPIGMSPELGRPHISKDPKRGYIEYDPIVRLEDGRILRGKHGLMDIRAEIGRSAYDADLINNKIIRDILRK